MTMFSGWTFVFGHASDEQTARLQDLDVKKVS